MDKKIYILSNKKIDNTINLPVMDIKFIKQNIPFEKYDALIFTSKYAVKSIDLNSSKWKQLPSFAIAPQTAKVIKELNGKLKFTGQTSHGNDFALELITPLKGKKVLYLRGEKAVSSLPNILNENGITCDEKIIYKSICKNFTIKQSLPKNSIIIFSSPTTVECFFNNFNWDDSFKAIAFGKKTASYFPTNITPNISQNSSLQSCVQEAFK